MHFADVRLAQGQYQIAVPASIDRSLPVLIDGVETHVDRLFLQHFTERVSRILTLWEEENNPFHEILLPLALRDKALMHSLLALSGSHLLNAGNRVEYEQAQAKHVDGALVCLREGLSKKNYAGSTTDAATALTLLLHSICSGDTRGQHRAHLNATRGILTLDHGVKDEKDANVPLMRFLYEFFTYHDVLDSITRLDRTATPLLRLPEFIMQPDSAALLGVLDGLFSHVSEITRLRRHIRNRRSQGIRPAVDFAILNEAVVIDANIRDWEPNQPEGTARYIAAQLYRQCTWIYLCRTVQESRCGKIKGAVETGLQYLNLLPEQSGTQSILLMPLFLLGCSAFHEEHRPEIKKRFEGLHKWSGLGNINPAFEVVQEVWKYMDAGDDERSWDWEQIMHDREWDFLVT